MVRALEAACHGEPGIIDLAPTYITHTSFADALLAAGGTLACTRAVLECQAQNAFAIIRPPGHHATPGKPMGFCLFNNLAIAAQAALRAGLTRLLIVDFDAHHGNGTQAVFWNDERVAYFSTHQENIFPGTGRMDEAPHARGRIVNVPLPPRAGDAAFALIFEQILAPLAARFAPEMIFVSAGFDARWDDSLTHLGLSSAGYYVLSQRLVELAEKYCAGRIVCALEGGYNPHALASGVDALLSALAGVEFIARDPSPYPEPDVRDRVEQVRNWHGI
jgi:acetoin utilization deacetylase AcuC-like enzyme